MEFSAALSIHSPGDFNSPLTPYGGWVDVRRYGHCWHPANVVAGWRPYTIGYWEWTDCGWYWASDEPWAWACYHYGYWVEDPVYGWVWVPGTDWAPAWVVWREAPDYIGWAPCGPGGAVVADSVFVFVDVHHFHDRLEPRELVFNNPRILRESREVRNFKRETRDFGGERRIVFANPGPGIDPIQRATGTRFTPRPVIDVVRQTPIPEPARRGLAERGAKRSPGNQQPAPPTGREQQRLYREAPPAQLPPTGRQEQRLYREVPNPQPAPQPRRQPGETPRRQQPPPEMPAPSTPRERPLPPTGFERGREQGQVPRREEPRVAPAPAPAPQPPNGFERGREQGQVPRREEPGVAPAPRPAPPQPQSPPGRDKERDREGQ